LNPIGFEIFANQGLKAGALGNVQGLVVQATKDEADVPFLANMCQRKQGVGA
jgi:hypothetical protein